MRPLGHRYIADAKRAVAAGRYGEARRLCEQALKKDKRDLGALELLGLLAVEQGILDEAARHFGKCVALKPGEPRYAYRVAQVLHEQGRVDEAVRGFDAVLRRRHDPDVAISKALALERVGRDDEARETIESLPDERRDAPTVVAVRARLAMRAGDPDAAATLLRSRLEEGALSETHRQSLLFALGRALEQAGAYDEAFAACREANEIGRPAFDAAGYVDRVDRLIRTFSGPSLDAMPRARDRADLPVIVAGMPRSGTTLAEQILAAHPSASGAGELIHLPRRVASLQIDLDSYEPYPECLEDLTASKVERLSREYLAVLRAVDRRARRIVDKTLDNFELLGLIALLVPGARVVSCRRDPLDTCVSCYMSQLVPQRFPWVTDLAALGTVYRQHERLIAHWREVLDLPFHEVVYERLTSDPEPEIRSLVEATGLAWDDACLRFHESGRAVMTLSYDQVSRPVYRSSVGRWKRFERHLGPLIDAIEKG